MEVSSPPSPHDAMAVETELSRASLSSTWRNNSSASAATSDFFGGVSVVYMWYMITGVNI